MKFSNYLLLFCLLTLAGCGYHLRGSGAGGKLNVNSVYLELQNITLIRQELTEQLIIRDVSLNDKPEDADRVLRLYNERFDRRVLSVDERTGKVTEYELEYRVELEILTADHKQLAEPQEISMIRDVTYDPNAPIGKFAEETLITEDMIRNAVNTILFRLQAVQ